MGYHRAGFEVVGVDIRPQPDYPFEFVRASAFMILQDQEWKEWIKGQTGHLGFAAIHASPPCHDHSSISRGMDGTADLLPQTIELLKATGLPWIAENVVGPTTTMDGWYFTLCGSMFGLEIRRHRRFGASMLVPTLGCNHSGSRPYTITGAGGSCDTPHSKKPAARDFWRYMEMPWMEGKPPYGVAQAIPPAYTEHIGHYLLAEVNRRAEVPA